MPEELDINTLKWMKRILERDLTKHKEHIAKLSGRIAEIKEWIKRVDINIKMQVSKEK